jgi:hypothetical protein
MCRIDTDHDPRRRYHHRKEGLCGLYAITELTIPGSVTTIAADTFSSCQGLKRVVLKEGIKEIRQQAFWHCSLLESVTLPASLQTIDYKAFAKCYSLTELTLPEGLTAIYSQAFAESALVSISIPQNLHDISSLIFYGCLNLKTVRYSGTQTQWKQLIFENGVFTACRMPITVTCSDGDIVYTE